jgi:hypothetical protein
MVPTTYDRVDVTIERIRRSNGSFERSLAALRRSRYRLQPIRGGDATPTLPDLSRLSLVIVEESTDNLDLFVTFPAGSRRRTSVARRCMTRCRWCGGVLVNPASAP